MDTRELTLYVYNDSVQMIGVVEKYMSLIWSDRYDEAGDFELEVIYEPAFKELLQKDRFVSIDYSEHMCIIEKVEISKDENGINTMIVSGRTVDIILERRIVLNKTEFKETDDGPITIQNAVGKLLNDNLINPKDSKRVIPNFSFLINYNEPIVSMVTQETYDKESLYDVIKGIASNMHIGFKVILNLDGQFTFNFYKGYDLSDYVLFSPYYDNLNNSKYFSSIEDYKNVMIISKQDDAYITAFNDIQEPDGLYRREIHANSSELKESEETELTDEQTIVKAQKKLITDHKIKTGFEGEIIPDVFYTYRIDYNVGDKVSFEDEFGNREAVYISEVVITYDENGLSIIPTFKEIDWDEEEYKWL